MNGPALRLKGGYGYWETSFYPIGGCFRRAPEGGKNITEVIRIFRRYKGVDTEVRFVDGTLGAVAGAHLEREGGNQ